MFKICAIIVTYNTGNNLYDCFNAIKNQVQEVVIVDNGSNCETIEILNKLANEKFVKVIYNRENLGIAAALNEGIRYAIKNNFEWVLTLDHDSIASPDMVEKMINAYLNLSNEEKNKIAMLTANNIEMALNNTNEIKNKYKQSSEVKEVISEITSGNLVRTEVFNKVGLYEEKLFIDYVDHEFCLRLKKNNFKIFLVKNAILYHKLGEISQKKILIKSVTFTNHSYIRRYYITRNRIYVWRKYFYVAPKWVIKDIIGSIKETIKIILFESDKRLKIQMILKGVVDNLKNLYGKIN